MAAVWISAIGILYSGHLQEDAGIPTPAHTNDLYGRLGAYGVDRAYVRKYVLPEWWDDSATTSRAGLSELAIHISQGIGLPLESLLNSAAPLEAPTNFDCKFKGGNKLNRPDIVVGICKRAAELATFATPGEAGRLLGIDPKEVRNEILADGHEWVDLENLTEYCWRQGVPVLHITGFPARVKKPDGMLVLVGDRPAIVICKRQKQPAWLLFVLAHELGHLIAGHVAPGGLLVDSEIDDEVNTEDHEETTADESALAVISAGRSYRSNRRPQNAKSLADACHRRGLQDAVYPGHIALNYVHGLSGSFHGLANAALAELYPSANAARILQRCMMRNMDFSQLAEDQAEYLLRIAGADGSPG